MGLILPGGPNFAYCTDSLTGTPPVALLPGPTFTANANDADGPSVAVLTNIPHDVHYLVIGISGLGTSTADSAALLDVLIDPAGGTAWQSAPLINDLVCGFTPNSGSGGIVTHLYYHFPLYIKSGASLGVRCRTAHTADITTGRCVMWAYGQPKNPDLWWCGSKVETLGVTPTTSKGTTVVAGNTGVYGSWTTIGTSTFRYGAIQLGANGSDSSMTAISYYWQMGAGSSKLAGTPTLYASASATEQLTLAGFGMPIWCDIPKDTILQLRGTASGIAEVTHNHALYGVAA